MTDAGDHDLGLDPLEREAVAWVRRLTSGQMTVADAETLRDWRSRSPAHGAAFATASRLWRDLEPAGRNLRWQSRVSGPAEIEERQRPASLSRRYLLGAGLASAAAAAAYALVRPPLDLWPSLTELRADYRTGTGEQRDISLSAETSVRMNTQTSIVIRSLESDNERLELIGGQALFSTTAREGRSLAVLAADRWITATEAQFDIRHLHGRTAPLVCVTCMQGSLAIVRDSETTPVIPGQQLRYDSNGPARLETVDPEIISAWQRGVLIFRATLLSDVVEEVNRYRPGRIVVVNSELGRSPVSGRFRIDNLNEILDQIARAFGAKVRSLPGGLVLLS
ncbi:FecR domain-containing protein [Bradyrhizobium sp. Leo170]|uniref:FecR family protein n=1 Tax=Bradyrhizobium sp. Leo170 TaxID=1571199 RepID=UPI00102E9512|nr:FecR domain-containing protein [Bradyrhizobium sp. Leo170]TAI67961.1 iron dicitrate transport regulator FecR [Bradyrhizobium sp. Leo170]